MEEKNKKTHDTGLRGFFGRRTGRALGVKRKHLLHTMLESHHYNPDEYDYETRPVWAEIGFGDGAHLAALMHAHPDKNFIGFEPYINGMGNFVNRIKDVPNDHVRIHMDDAIPVLHRMPDACLDRLYVLNPDPWPKSRHHKRRIINANNLDVFARLLKPGSWLVMATDVAELADHMITACTNHPAFTTTAETPNTYATQPDWWMLITRYAQKGIDSGRKEFYIVFERV